MERLGRDELNEISSHLSYRDLQSMEQAGYMKPLLPNEVYIERKDKKRKDESIKLADDLMRELETDITQIVLYEDKKPKIIFYKLDNIFHITMGANYEAKNIVKC